MPILALTLFAACSNGREVEGAARGPSGATPSENPSRIANSQLRTDVHGVWRITRGTAAPWAQQGAPPDAGALVGQVVRVSDARMDGPQVLRCASPRQAPTRSAPEGLFQGNLPAPATTTARTLGFAAGEVDGVRLECDAGSFDFHWADDVTMLLALDNVILTLDRSPGSLAADGTPEAAVQKFLETHFAGPMAFDAASSVARRPFLTDSFSAEITRYFARSESKGDASSDEAPAIDGDAFTDSQEYPTRFSVQTASVVADSATVPVRFSDGYASKMLSYQLRQREGAWRIDDVRDSRGMSMRAMLR